MRKCILEKKIFAYRIQRETMVLHLSIIGLPSSMNNSEYMYWYVNSKLLQIRYIDRVWGASSSFWQSQWEKIYDYFEGDPWYMSIIGKFPELHAWFNLWEVTWTYS